MTTDPAAADRLSTQDTRPALLEELTRLLADARATAEQDPFANPIQLLATALGGRLAAGQVDEEALEGLVRRLTLDAFTGRAARLRAYLGEADPERNAAIVEGLIRKAATGPQGELVAFETFAARMERVHYGFVVTAHPTFSLSSALQRDLVSLAFGRDPSGAVLDEEARARLLERVEAAQHRPEERLDLDEEHRQAMIVVRHLRAALRRAHKIVLQVAAGLWPERWRALVPRLVSVASWVGYDTDGRSDIPWQASFGKRLAMQAEQLAHYAESVRGLRCGLAQGDPLGPLLELIEARLALALKSCEDECRAFASPDAESIARGARSMAAHRAFRMADAGELAGLLERALAAATTPEAACALAVLRAEVASLGLTAAATHVRINALQLHNALRRQTGMEHAPDDPAHRLTYLAAMTRLIEEARPVRINFGSIAQEKATARRAMMLVAQMLGHLDAAEPVRFLIAECETPVTLLAALYFAKLFGVEERIDISPLFETRKALERGVAILEGALAVPAWRDYVRARGRLCLQTGYSDAGRYLGQTAAAVAIERIRLGLAGLLARHGLEGIEVVIFDTHGESIGRGAHPESLAERLRYVDTPESRRRFEAAGLEVVQETSWQGGDGYLWFITEDSAFAVLTRVLEHVLEPLDEQPDAFYAERAYGDEFFAAVRLFNERVIEEPAYAALLGVYGSNLLYPSGSRPVRRQFDAGGRPAALDHPSQIRAIPHNAVLQQLGILANSIGGVGQAVAKDPDRFLALYRESPRFRRLMRMVEHAFMFTDLAVVKACLDRFDPGFWLTRAEAARDPAEHEELRTVAEHVERMGLHEKLGRIFRILQRDHMDLARALRTHRRLTRRAGERPIVVDAATRDNLHMLHALRLALIERLIRRAVRIPDFSDRHAATHDGLIEAVIRLEVEPALRLLAEIFPRLEAAGPPLDWGEPSTYPGDDGQSYAEEHARLFRPMARDHELVRRIGGAVVHHLGAIG
ncbi:phosphoenolpyruvate carboxylase [Marinimicrococcus flavescens]|uniref:Phosphoenolpyruvate carboxylase n=1 Tax=Marinimicrococcus flavescens TaxID=3031815 RepID=A0AAP3V0I5_9PROT|nr:phosphoenolpyruvate carboxylase [Marinimicrococcus flavescens]